MIPNHSYYIEPIPKLQHLYELHFHYRLMIQNAVRSYCGRQEKTQTEKTKFTQKPPEKTSSLKPLVLDCGKGLLACSIR